MKTLTLALVIAACLSGKALAQLSADDIQWINQCIADNKRAAPETVVRKYCMCMNERMDDDEDQSVTQWEKSHPEDQKACDAEAGWK